MSTRGKVFAACWTVLAALGVIAGVAADVPAAIQNSFRYGPSLLQDPNTWWIGLTALFYGVFLAVLIRRDKKRDPKGIPHSLLERVKRLDAIKCCIQESLSRHSKRKNRTKHISELSPEDAQLIVDDLKTTLPGMLLKKVGHKEYSDYMKAMGAVTSNEPREALLQAYGSLFKYSTEVFASFGKDIAKDVMNVVSRLVSVELEQLKKPASDD